eukprot:scaffold312997_cov79-Cyclotella_meneghiniana.AAC.1
MPITGVSESEIVDLLLFAIWWGEDVILALLDTFAIFDETLVGRLVGIGMGGEGSSGSEHAN